MKGKIVKIRALKETVRCLNCHKENEFFYLSDFSYGLDMYPILDGKGYAYVNKIEDKTFAELDEIISKVLSKYNVVMNDSKFADCINSVFGVTCDMIEDKPIETEYINYSKKCLFCGKKGFENLIVKPVELVDIIVYAITHQTWDTYSNKKKYEIVQAELIKKNIVIEKI